MFAIIRAKQGATQISTQCQKVLNWQHARGYIAAAKGPFLSQTFLEEARTPAWVPTLK
jgi:hypothetical protein